MAVVTLISIITIMCIMIFSPFFSTTVPKSADKVLLDTVVGTVGAGNYSYWQLGHTGPLQIELRSLLGDADLYVSDTPRPTYEIEGNNLSSVTCGIDIVKVPTDFPRPLGIGIFGHWSHIQTDYSIQVFLETESSSPRQHFHDLIMDGARVVKARIDPSRSKNHMDDSEPSFLQVWILRLLSSLFELFIL